MLGHRRQIGVLAAFVIVLAASLAPPSAAGQKKSEKKEVPRGTPVLWREPADIERRDLYLGPGGARMRPDLRRVTDRKSVV
jgi:hypothetical protein